MSLENTIKKRLFFCLALAVFRGILFVSKKRVRERIYG